MNTIREIQKINDVELERGMAGTAASWHTKYAESAWVYVGNLDMDLTEGDVICVMSQYGEVEDIHLVRDNDTGKSKGFCFLKYEDARSCILAVDNLIGTKVCNRPLRIDHVERYRLPKHVIEQEEEKERRLQPGHAYLGKEIANEYNIARGQDLFARPPPPPQPMKQDENEALNTTKKDDDDEKKDRRKKAKHKRRKKDRDNSDDDDNDDDADEERRKKRRKKERERRHKDDDMEDDDDDGDDRRKSKRKHKTEKPCKSKDKQYDDDGDNDHRRDHRPPKKDRDKRREDEEDDDDRRRSRR